jgi:hypothetical protein
MFGHTTYMITVCEYIPEYMITVCGESELEFPMNPFLACLSVDVEGAFAGGTPWGFLLEIRRNVNDPGNPMKDSDWFSVPAQNYREKYIYTESDAELGAWFLDFSGRIAFYRHPIIVLEGILGYRYRNLSYEIFGVEGWELDLEGERVPFKAYEGENVLDYDIRYHIPYVGMGACISPSPSWVIDTELIYSPKTSAKDHDDHVLRFKTAESECSGKTFIGKLEVIWGPRRPEGRRSWFAGIGAELVHISTEGDQVQTWYGDDPMTPGYDDTGERYSNIDTEITSSCQSVYVRMGREF